MTAPNPLTGTRSQTILTETLRFTPSTARTLLLNHRGAIKIVGMCISHVTAPTSNVTYALQSYSGTTGVDITSTVQANPAAGAITEISTLASGATLTRPANEILHLNVTVNSGTPVAAVLTLSYVMLDA